MKEQNEKERDEELRFKCIHEAVKSTPNEDQSKGVVERAKEIYDFVKGGNK